jgi:hypothetical protein
MSSIVYRKHEVFTSVAASWTEERREVETAAAMNAIGVACRLVNTSPDGRVAWQRVSDSDASGEDRLVGQMDGRAVLALHVKPGVTKAGKIMVTVILAATATNPPRTVSIRAETIRSIRA